MQKIKSFFQQELSLENVYFLAIKSGFACSLAYLLDILIGNKDHLSSVFVAMLCVSPTILMGLKRSWAQLTGSLMGGVTATILLFFDMPQIVSLFLSVTLAIFLAVSFKQWLGYQVAGFTALYILVLPGGTPLATLEARMVALLIGSFSGFIINLTISSLDYRRIFTKKILVIEKVISKLLVEAVEKGPGHLRQGFNFTSKLEQEMHIAWGELKVRRSSKSLKEINQLWERLHQYSHFLHLIIALDYLSEEIEVDIKKVKLYLKWLCNKEGDPPRLPPEMELVSKKLNVLRQKIKL